MVLFLTSCATYVPPGPPAYQDGWRDGCPSGESAAGYIYSSWQKNVERFQVYSLYAMGWNDAYDKCKTSMEDTKAMSRRFRVFR
jgi:hypothetical protein